VASIQFRHLHLHANLIVSLYHKKSSALIALLHSEEDDLLKGHGFSRAATSNKINVGFSP